MTVPAKAGIKPDEALLAGEIPTGYKRTHLRCRALRHSWMHSNDVVQHPTKAWVGGISSICDVCGTVRILWLSGSGARYGASYTYPDGYLIKRDRKVDDGQLALPAPKPLEWRRQFVSNLGFPQQVEPIRRAQRTRK